MGGTCMLQWSKNTAARAVLVAILGTAGAATLRAVAPGISEALITTAAGLAAAIPAVIAYNLFSNQIREFGSRMDDFTLELMNILERAQTPSRNTMAEVPEYRG